MTHDTGKKRFAALIHQKNERFCEIDGVSYRWGAHPEALLSVHKEGFGTFVTLELASKIRGKLWAIWEPYVDLRRCSLSLLADTNFVLGFRFETLIASPVCHLRFFILQSVPGFRIPGFAWTRGEPWPRQQTGRNKNPHMKLSVIFTFNFVPFSLTSLVTEKMRGKTKDFRVKKKS